MEKSQGIAKLKKILGVYPTDDLHQLLYVISGLTPTSKRLAELVLELSLMDEDRQELKTTKRRASCV